MSKYDMSFRHHGLKWIAPTWLLIFRLHLLKFERVIHMGGNRCHELQLDSAICVLKTRLARRMREAPTGEEG